MKKGWQIAFVSGILATTLLIGAATTNAQQAPDPRIADLVQAGKIRVGVRNIGYQNEVGICRENRNLISKLFCDFDFSTFSVSIFFDFRFSIFFF